MVDPAKSPACRFVDRGMTASVPRSASLMKMTGVEVLVAVEHRRRAGGRRGAPASWRVARLVGHRGVGLHRWDRHRLGRRGRGDRIDRRRPDCQVHDPRPTVARRRGSRTAHWSSAGWWPSSGSSSFLSWECSSASSLASTRRSSSGSVHGRRGRRPRQPCAPWVFRLLIELTSTLLAAAVWIVGVTIT